MAFPPVAILDGVRTPFVKANGQLSTRGPLALATHVTTPLLNHDARQTTTDDRTQVVFGTALSYPKFVYGGREVAIASGHAYVNGHGTEYACATSTKTAVEAAHLLALGTADMVVAGGSESLSHQPLIVSDTTDQVARMPRHRDPQAFAKALAKLSIAELLPVLPPVSEPYNKETLAWSAETLMQAYGVSRGDADLYATQTQQRAAAAKHHLAPRILAIEANGTLIAEDDLVRGDTTVEVLATLPAVYETGGVTSGNASRLTDGAAAVLLTSHTHAKQHGLQPQGLITHAALTAHDPAVGVLLGPAFAIPRVLDAAGMTLADVDVIEIHEAFAGQVLANLNALASDTFATQHLNRTHAFGTIDPMAINAWGGSLSLGHPFGATGSRLIMHAVDRLKAEDKQVALIALCIGGARGAAMIIQRDVEA